MNRVEQEVAVKNGYLEHLNRGSAKVYRYHAPGTPSLDIVVREKYRQSMSGEVPPAMMEKEQQPWTKRDWALTLGVAAASLLIFYLLLKYKAITI